MVGIFRQLIKKEFGINKYQVYSSSIRNGMRESVPRNRDVYNDIFVYLQEKDLNMISVMQKRLNESILTTFRISRNYSLVLLAYLGSCLFLILQDLVPWITTASIILLSSCFIAKTYEFVVNKYCYIDAQIILAYKTALDNILLRKK